MDNDTSAQITRLRRQIHIIVDELVLVEQKKSTSMHRNSAGIISDGVTGTDDLQLKQLANKLLHKPTMQLRQEKLSGDEIEEVVFNIGRQLREHCTGIADTSAK